jgi:hypothetical protein
MWTLHPECNDDVSFSWSSSFHGSPIFILANKLKLLKSKLIVWNKENFGDVHIAVNFAEANLNHIQSNLNIHGPTDALLLEEKLAQESFDLALARHELLWRQKANLN